ncbi:hypothetical protein [Alicyclobacillus acidocaldarius]|uniref:Uncharacterized protein n=1 Tax=Alicyclobacillus acidocaldarius subsp. acidocaldarius (strain ATCC 27009 / DSM 446 / BCRC 14685 / JCM 5260 / KCTC 1825 / NBRC 15652 / NCIMB 11725 / NRRL B-14509 / 104-IA) TaxID=521098 RepID=C8WSP1_ALIAD|nr:hypothetical protein [Alicyclobacillus acidocaldarius]ACV57547.1 hypothetical protein Aaci_0489 [Alicyclobacillus acidocaldarius subsp. acidocaldarius DSM 446]
MTTKLWFITDGENYGYVVADSPVEALQTATGTIVDDEFEWPFCQEIVIRLVPSGDLVTLCDEGEEPVTKRAVDWVREQAETPCVIGVAEL